MSGYMVFCGKQWFRVYERLQSVACSYWWSTLVYSVAFQQLFSTVISVIYTNSLQQWQETGNTVQLAKNMKFALSTQAFIQHKYTPGE